ncbi:MAG: hypothetical protein AB7I59_10375 [Geminicoccaceae bacterium]
MAGFAMGDRALVEVCAALAEARRRIAAGHDAQLAHLSSQLAEVAAEATRAAPSTLIALLDELMGFVGQLELERAEAGARLAAFERHRRARRSYGAGSAGS